MIEKLHPSIRPRAIAFLADAWDAGVELVVTSGYRTFAEQDALYKKGRTEPGKIVTNAKAGESWHNYGLAFDVAFVKADGTIWWPNGSEWADLAQIGKANGLEWGGDYKTIYDPPHFAYHPGLTIEQAKQGARPT